MRLGIDIDNVISNFDSGLLKEYIKYDKNLRNTGIVNKQAKYIRNGMFDWTDDEDKLFYKNNIDETIEKKAYKKNDVEWCFLKVFNAL